VASEDLSKPQLQLSGNLHDNHSHQVGREWPSSWAPCLCEQSTEAVLLGHRQGLGSGKVCEGFKGQGVLTSMCAVGEKFQLCQSQNAWAWP
jgi:hypothetical protein